MQRLRLPCAFVVRDATGGSGPADTAVWLRAETLVVIHVDHEIDIPLREEFHRLLLADELSVEAADGMVRLDRGFVVHVAPFP